MFRSRNRDLLFYQGENDHFWATPANEPDEQAAPDGTLMIRPGTSGAMHQPDRTLLLSARGSSRGGGLHQRNANLANGSFWTPRPVTRDGGLGDTIRDRSPQASASGGRQAMPPRLKDKVDPLEAWGFGAVADTLKAPKAPPLPRSSRRPSSTRREAVGEELAEGVVSEMTPRMPRGAARTPPPDGAATPRRRAPVVKATTPTPSKAPLFGRGPDVGLRSIQPTEQVSAQSTSVRRGAASGFAGDFPFPVQLLSGSTVQDLNGGNVGNGPTRVSRKGKRGNGSRGNVLAPSGENHGRGTYEGRPARPVSSGVVAPPGRPGNGVEDALGGGESLAAAATSGDAWITISDLTANGMEEPQKISGASNPLLASTKVKDEGTEFGRAFAAAARVNKAVARAETRKAQKASELKVGQTQQTARSMVSSKFDEANGLSFSRSFGNGDEDPERQIRDAKKKAYKEEMRLLAGIPDSKTDFPYCPSHAWKAEISRQNPRFEYYPLRHEVDVFEVNEEGNREQRTTDLTHNEMLTRPSHRDACGFNRVKGVVEYADLLRSTNERWHPQFHESLQKNERAFFRKSGEVVRFVDIMLRQNYKI